MRFLADFVLDSDLCLEPGGGPLVLRAPNNDFALIISNASEADRALCDGVLSAQLTFEADSFENVRATAREKLSDALNILTYTTNRKFVLKLLKRIIDWSPGQVERRALIFVEQAEWDVAEPALDPAYIDTAERLLAMGPSDEQQVALRWYRMGIAAENSEEQFSYFWFALEIAAEALKGAERVASKCPKCQAPLFCEVCEEYPAHRRFRGEAILQLIERVYPDEPQEVFRALQLIRHTLMHGGRISSVISQLPCDQEQAVNTLAVVTWRALNLMFRGPNSYPEKPLTFGDPGGVVRRVIVASVDVSTRMPGDPDNPCLEDFPAFKFEIKPAPGPAPAPEAASPAKRQTGGG